MTASGRRPILIVDDDPEAVALTKHALAKAGIKTQIDAVKEGEDAITYLKNRLAEGDHTLPLLVFLDLTMPGTAGFHVLTWIRNQPRLRRGLTVVLSSSNAPRQGEKAGLLARKLDTKYPVAAEVRTLFQIASVMLTVEEIERLVLPAVKSPAANAS